MPQESAGPNPAPAAQAIQAGVAVSPAQAADVPLAADTVAAQSSARLQASLRTAGASTGELSDGTATPIAVSNPRHAQASPSHRTPLLYRDGHDDGGDGGGRSGGGGTDQRATAAPLDAMVQSLLRCGAAADGGIVTASVVVSACPDDAACFAMGGDEGSDKHHRNPLLTRAALDRAMNEHGVSVLGPAESATVLPWAVEGEDHSTHILAVPDIPADLNELHSTGLWWEGERFRGIRPFMAFCEGWVTSWWYGGALVLLWVAQVAILAAQPPRARSTRSVAAKRPEAYVVALAVQTAAVALMLPFMRWSMVRRCLGFDFGVILLLLLSLTGAAYIATTGMAHVGDTDDSSERFELQTTSASLAVLRGLMISFALLVPILADALRFPATSYCRVLWNERLLVSPKALLIGHVAVVSLFFGITLALIRKQDHVIVKQEFMWADITAFEAFVDFTIAVFAAKLALRSRNGGLGARSLPWRVFRLRSREHTRGDGLDGAINVVRLSVLVPRDEAWNPQRILWHHSGIGISVRHRDTGVSGHSLATARETPAGSPTGSNANGGGFGQPFLAANDADAESPTARVIATSETALSPSRHHRRGGRYASTLTVPAALELFPSGPICRCLPESMSRNVAEAPHFGRWATAIFVGSMVAINGMRYVSFFVDNGRSANDDTTSDVLLAITVLLKAAFVVVYVYALCIVPLHSVALCARSFDFWVLVWWYLALVADDVWADHLAAGGDAVDTIGLCIIPLRLAVLFGVAVAFLDHHPRFSATQRAVVALAMAAWVVAYAVMQQLVLNRHHSNAKGEVHFLITIAGKYDICPSTLAQGARMLMFAMLLKYAYRYRQRGAAADHHGGGDHPDSACYATSRCALRELPS